MGDAEARRANRGWWDTDADDYQADHGAFLGDVDFVWCPEGLREADARLLGGVSGRRVLEVGAGAAAAARWLATQGARPVAFDLSAGMLRHAAEAADRSGVRVPLVQADALALPFADRSFDVACTAFGAIPFVDDSAALLAEVHRVLRPGGRWVFSVTHPMRWIFLDDPGEGGLTAVHSYFDRSPTWSRTRQAWPPTSSSTAPSATGSASWSAPGSGCWTWWSRNGRRDTRESGGSGARCADDSSPAPPSSSPRSPPAERVAPAVRPAFHRSPVG